MERLTKTRTIAFLLIFVLILGLFSMRMYGKQIRDADPVSRAGSTYESLTRVVAARGDILDRNGNVLVSNRASFDLVFNNYVILNSDNRNEALRTLIARCEEIGQTYNEDFPVTLTKPYEYTLDDYGASWQSYFRAFLDEWGIDSDVSASHLIRILREDYGIPEDWSDEDARKVIGLRYEISLRTGITNLPAFVFIHDISAENLSVILETNTPGLNVESTTVREYETTHAAHILGFVAPMDPDQYEKYKDNPDYSMDAEVGRSGLELAFEEYLHGVDGWKRTVVDSNGNVVAEYYDTEPRAGANVETSIDLELQILAEQKLEEHILDLRENGVNDEGYAKDAQGGAIVVMNVKTGEVLACASYPTYDPARYHEDYNELLEADYNPLINRALNSTYAPGSIFKMAMTVAGIDSGAITRYTPITDEGVYRKYEEYGFAPQCLIWTNNPGSTHGTINVEEALMVSCNYFFYKLGDEIGIDTIDKTVKALGLGEYTGVEIPESKGHRANPESKKEIYGDDYGDWFQADTVTASIGQSEAAFTPIQMCSYACTLANQGVRYRATFLSRVVSADYKTLLDQMEPEILSTLDVSDEAYAAYIEGMHMAAQGTTASGLVGTSYSTFADYPMDVCAKTGTAQHGSGGSDNCSYVAFAPMEDPEIAVAIFVERGAYGGRLAPIARSIFDAYFDQTTSEENLPLENGLD